MYLGKTDEKLLVNSLSW